MSDIQPKTQTSPFPRIQDRMLDRLTKEADERTLQPQEVDWVAIHRQAALARK